MTKRLIPLLFLFVFVMISAGTELDYWKSQKYADLVIELEKIDFSKDGIGSLFSDPRVKFYPSIVKRTKKTTKTKVIKLADLNSKLMREESIKRGKEFLEKNREVLERVEKEYGVDKEIIVAILRIETDLGEILGSYQVFGAYNSMIFYAEASSSRSKWAKEQIVALLVICQKLQINPLTLNGSRAGAIGIPQFIPVSYLEFAVDGNKDGKVDLFNIEDSVYSIANYLARSNWKKNKSKAVYAYNHSWNYVGGVLAYAKKLKE